MSSPQLKAIFAMASNRVIGKDGGLPWHLPEDFKWFKKLTVGHPVLMGRKTMESLPNGPLPRRRNVVVSGSLPAGGAPEGFEVVPNPEAALELLASEETIFLIGGAGLFEALLPRCDELYLSYVFHPYEGDTCLPEFESEFQIKEVLHRDEDFELRHYTRHFREPSGV